LNGKQRQRWPALMSSMYALHVNLEIMVSIRV
jgi:hypothetical protein